MWIALIIIAVLCLLYLFMLMGRKKHKRLRRLRKWSYAHRGLHDAQKPENSMSAFQAALDNGYGIELDVHLMRDGKLAVIHDSSLKRVAGADVNIEDLNAKELRKYRLTGTDEQIPLFKDVLVLFERKAPLIVELKSVNGNHEALCKATMKMLDKYHVIYCVESFDPRVVAWLRKNRPDVCRGQLTENWFRSKVALPKPLQFALTFHLSNVYTRPDFLAVRYSHRKVFGTGICRKLLGIQGVSWTLQSQEEYDTAVKEGWIPIFENFMP